MPLLAGTFHKVLYIGLICINYACQIFSPVLGVGVTVPAYCGDYALYLKAVGVCQQPYGRFIVIGLHLRRADIGHYNYSGLERTGLCFLSCT